MAKSQKHADAAEEFLSAARDGLDLFQNGTEKDRAAAQQSALVGIGYAIMHLADNLSMLTLPEAQR